MAMIVAESGFPSVSVSGLSRRAGVSRSTFHACFADLRACFTAILDLGFERTSTLVTLAFAQETRWQDGLRAALASLLVFFDSEPLLTRTWFIDSLAAGTWSLEHRERHIAELRRLIVRSWISDEANLPVPVPPQGVMTSLTGLIQTRLVADSEVPLVELLAPLVGLATAAYLDGPSVRCEVDRAAELAHALRASEISRSGAAFDQGGPAVATPALVAASSLVNSRSRRPLECLLFIAEASGCSNRGIARALRIRHESQVALLLKRLVQLDLVRKRSCGVGKQNAWSLTERGRSLIDALSRTECIGGVQAIEIESSPASG
jgi:AcrR family transcriptional regulator